LSPAGTVTAPDGGVDGPLRMAVFPQICAGGVDGAVPPGGGGSVVVVGGDVVVVGGDVVVVGGDVVVVGGDVVVVGAVVVVVGALGGCSRIEADAAALVVGAIVHGFAWLLYAMVAVAAWEPRPLFTVAPRSAPGGAVATPRTAALPSPNTSMLPAGAVAIGGEIVPVPEAAPPTGFTGSVPENAAVTMVTCDGGFTVADTRVSEPSATCVQPTNRSSAVLTTSKRTFHPGVHAIVELAGETETNVTSTLPACVPAGRAVRGVPVRFAANVVTEPTGWMPLAVALGALTICDARTSANTPTRATATVLNVRRGLRETSDTAAAPFLARDWISTNAGLCLNARTNRSATRRSSRHTEGHVYPCPHTVMAPRGSHPDRNNDPTVNGGSLCLVVGSARILIDSWVTRASPQFRTLVCHVSKTRAC
jgi:hypothetical protein